ncbi:MAG: type I secretion system permease/ATPase, partial [Pseudomonadota bacterium]
MQPQALDHPAASAETAPTIQDVDAPFLDNPRPALSDPIERLLASGQLGSIRITPREGWPERAEPAPATQGPSLATQAAAHREDRGVEAAPSQPSATTQPEEPRTAAPQPVTSKTAASQPVAPPSSEQASATPATAIAQRVDPADPRLASSNTPHAEAEPAAPSSPRDVAIRNALENLPLPGGRSAGVTRSAPLAGDPARATAARSSPAAGRANADPAHNAAPSRSRPAKVQPALHAPDAFVAAAASTRSPDATDAATGSTADKPDATPALRHMPAGTRSRLGAFINRQGEAKPAAMPPVDHAAAERAAAQKAANGSARPNAEPPGAEISDAIGASRSAFGSLALFSLIINILMLAGPLFMLQVYDRVMTSGSVPTLVALFAMTAALYGIIGILEFVRSRVVVRIGIEVDARLSNRVFTATLKRALTAPEASRHAMRELEHLRAFIAGPGPISFLDAPWTPLYLLVIFMLHWVLGVAAVIGAVILLLIAWLAEIRSRRPLTQASQSAAHALELADTGHRNAEALTAMGMVKAYRQHWQQANADTLGWQVTAADRVGTTTALSKTIRLLMQSTMLAIGAALALQNQISAGTIVAATIIFGRALAPVEQAIGHWKGFARAREAFYKLSDLLAKAPRDPKRTALPAPKGVLEIKALRVAAPETRQLILANLNFQVVPGQMLAVIGPSASGKSTLARALVGLWPPFSGSIRLDGARLDQWSHDDLGQHIGYLPQSADLFSGSVRDNIARFRADAKDEDIVHAARMAHAHDLILALPKGYETQLGSFGTYLSAGQRQRIGLARALFGNPALVVLDEPNSNLDRQGDDALAQAIDGMRKRGQTVVLVSHRVQAIQQAAQTLDFAPPFQYGHPQQFKLSSQLALLAPGDLDHVLYANSGSEAVDTALKVALAYHRSRGEGSRTRFI